MNVQLRVPRTKDEFLRWVERQEGRFEFAGGRAVMMVRVSNRHARLTTRLASMLVGALPEQEYLVAASEFGVHIGEQMRFPDVVVDRQPPGPRAYDAVAPVLIGEVTSPGSMATDFGAKVREYTSLPTLSAYLVLSQDEARVWVYRRGEDATFPPEPEMLVGGEESVALPALGLVLPLAELYRGVVDGPTPPTSAPAA